MKLWHAPTGRLIRGHVLDVGYTGFRRALKELDKRLYFTWNPDKLKGEGCWEIRILPSLKTAVYKGTYQGVDFLELEYVEHRDMHHVLDCAFLNYDAIRKLKEMDTWNKDHWIHDVEYAQAKKAEVQDAAARKERLYNIQQNRSAMRDILEAVRSGMDLGRIITSIKWEMK